MLVLCLLLHIVENKKISVLRHRTRKYQMHSYTYKGEESISIAVFLFKSKSWFIMTRTPSPSWDHCRVSLTEACYSQFAGDQHLSFAHRHQRIFKCRQWVKREKGKKLPTQNMFFETEEKNRHCKEHVQVGETTNQKKVHDGLSVCSYFLLAL